MSVVKDAPTKLKSNKILSELSDLSSNQLTVVQLKNMFTEENKEDRGILFVLNDNQNTCLNSGRMWKINVGSMVL